MNAEPSDVVDVVEEYVYRERSDASKFDNRAPLDEAGINALHEMAARVYAKGYEEGRRVQASRDLHRRQREMEARKDEGARS